MGNIKFHIMRVTLLMLFLYGFAIKENLAEWPIDAWLAPCSELGSSCIKFYGCEKGGCVLEDFKSIECLCPKPPKPPKTCSELGDLFPACKFYGCDKGNENGKCVIGFFTTIACKCTKPPVTKPPVTFPPFQDCWNGNKCLSDKQCGKNGKCIGVAFHPSIPPKIAQVGTCKCYEDEDVV